jgi:hypothetical protein
MCSMKECWSGPCSKRNSIVLESEMKEVNIGNRVDRLQLS